MNDIVLTSLTNLFALFVSSMHIDYERGKTICADNLRQFCSEKATEQYMELFQSLLDMYDLSEPDYEQTISGLFSRLRNQIPESEQTLLLIRLVELIADTSGESGHLIEPSTGIRNLFMRAIDMIGLDDETCDDVRDFLMFSTESARKDARRNVGVGTAEGIDGRFAVIILRRYNCTLVSYDGPEQLTLGETPMRRRHFRVWTRSGIIKSAAGVPVYYTPFIERVLGEGESSKLSITFEGREVDFRYPGGENGLHKFSFRLHSGQMVAVMGGSGAGKSTLFNLLNGSMRPDSGEVLINGEPMERHTSLIGFVPQDDLLIEELTVWENLMFTARLYFGGETEEQLTERVRRCLTDLDLIEFARLKVGSPLNKTISGGQRKRLNIALELIREPYILFLDEPTSGLSSADSEKVIHLLKKQTFSGRLVLANIHQPSSDIYKLFDHLWMLDMGGRPIYNGNPIEAITYFKTCAHMADAESAVCPACGTVNPEVMMNIIDEKKLDSAGRTTTERKVSPQEWYERYCAEASVQPAAETTDHSVQPAAETTDYRLQTTDSSVQPAAETTDCRLQTTDSSAKGEKPAAGIEDTRRRTTAVRQFAIYLERTLRCKLANRQFMAISLLEAPLLALIVAFLTRFSGEGGYSLMYNHNLPSYYFMAIIVAVFMGMSLTAEEIFRDKALLRRERFLHLSFTSYMSSKIVFTALVTALQTLLFLVVGNTLLAITDLWLTWWLVLFTTGFLSGLIGLLLSRTLKSVVAIYITIPILLIPQILLCGVVVPFTDLDSHSKTGNVPLVGDLIPSRWAFEALAVETFKANSYTERFFDMQRGQYELQLFVNGYLAKMRSVAQEEAFYRQTGDGDYRYAHAMPLLHRESAYISQLFDLEAPADTSLGAQKVWIDRTDSLLTRRSKRWTRALDRAKKEYIAANGMQALQDLQRNHTNKKLEQMLTESNDGTMVRVEEDAIVPLYATAYLDPKTRCGRAPFYSHVKLLGAWRIDTLWFNVAVLWAMCALAMAFLYRKMK